LLRRFLPWLPLPTPPPPKPPKNRQNLPVDGRLPLWHDSPHGECGQKPILPHPRSVNNRRGGKKAISYQFALQYKLVPLE
jgi:hypothetical protein